MNIKIMKFISILFSIVSGPGVIFLIPYFFDKWKYAEFMLFLVSYQVYGIISSLGMEIEAPKSKVHPKKVFNILFVISFCVLNIEFLILENNLALSFFIASCILVNNYSTVFLNYLIISNNVWRYSALLVFKSVILISSFVFCYYSDANIIYGFLVATILSSISIVFLSRDIVNRYFLFKKVGYKRLIKNGYFILVVNCCSSLPFVLDKILAKKNLSIEDFSRYVIALGWMVPLVYIGNAIQQYFVSIDVIKNWIDYLKSVLLMLVISIGYFLFVMLFSWLFKVPYFESHKEFINYSFPVFSWYCLFCSFAFPMAAYIQKRADSNFTFRLQNFSLFSALTSLMIFFMFYKFFNESRSMIYLYSYICCTLVLLPRVILFKDKLS